MEAEGTMSLPSRNLLAASVALGALAAGIAFLLYRYPLLLLMSWEARKESSCGWCDAREINGSGSSEFHSVVQKAHAEPFSLICS